jgi:hypothetical protein
MLDKDDTDDAGVGGCVADRSPNFRRCCGNCFDDGLAAASSTVTISSNVVTTATIVISIDVAGILLILSSSP